MSQTCSNLDIYYLSDHRGRLGHDRMVVGFMDLQLHMQSVKFTTNIVSLNPV